MSAQGRRAKRAREKFWREAPGRFIPWRGKPPGFYVGMSIKGPPEMFGLPPDDPDAPPPEPMVVTEVDQAQGRVTVRPARDYPAPGIYNANEVLKLRLPR